MTWNDAGISLFIFAKTGLIYGTQDHDSKQRRLRVAAYARLDEKIAS
jgi:hypothetical protein